MAGRGGRIVTATLRGIGMTSQRTRDRLVRRLREEGIDNAQVLAHFGVQQG